MNIEIESFTSHFLSLAFIPLILVMLDTIYKPTDQILGLRPQKKGGSNEGRRDCRNPQK